MTVEEIADPDAYSSGEAPSDDAVLEEIYASQAENHIQVPPLSTPNPFPPDTAPTPYQWICAMQQDWIRLGITEHSEDELWCAAGYTYLQKML